MKSRAISRLRRAAQTLTKCAAVAVIGSGVIVAIVASGDVPVAQAAGLIDIRPETVISAFAIGDIVEGGGVPRWDP